MATYAIVKTGGKQYKVAVGDVVKVEKLDAEPGRDGVAAGRPGRRRREGDHRRQARWPRSRSPARCSSTPRAPRSASTSSRTRPATTSGRDTVSS